MPDAAETTRTRRPAPVLREGAVFDGLLVLPGPAYIDGAISGEVLAAGDIWVGPGGTVRADLEGQTIIIEGCVEGDVVARDRIELRESARVQGRVSAPRLCVADGSLVDGPCAAGPPPSPDESPEDDPETRSQGPASP